MTINEYRLIAANFLQSNKKIVELYNSQVFRNALFTTPIKHTQSHFLSKKINIRFK
jgi:hypothetical protein